MTITMTTLDNGLRVITDKIDTVETISCGTWVNVGTRHETKDVNGVSHFLEHMAFKGTENRSALKIAQEIEDVGGYLNAYTGREITAYYAKGLKADMPLMVDILGDILQNSIFDPVEFHREQGVIIQEIGQSNDTPDDIVFDYFQETCYPDQPMGWPTLGTEQLIQSMTPKIIKDYMDNHYSLANMVCAAAGNVDHDAFVHEVQKNFTKMTPDIPLQIAPANYCGGDLRIEKDLEQAHIILGFESVPSEHEDFYPTMVYSTMMGGGMSSRLFQEIREKHGLVYSVFTSRATYKDSGQFYIYAGTGPDKLETLAPILRTELLKSQDGFTQEELLRAKAQLKTSLLMGLESTSNRCEKIASQTLRYGRILSPEEICRAIDAVNNDDLKRSIKRMFESKHTLTAYGPIQELPSKVW